MEQDGRTNLEKPQAVTELSQCHVVHTLGISNVILYWFPQFIFDEISEIKLIFVNIHCAIHEFVDMFHSGPFSLVSGQ